jgi:hypothetical protein
MFAILATFACTMFIDPEPGPGVLAVVLTMSLARSHLDRDAHGHLESAVALPLAALASIGVGALLQSSPIIGAVAFMLGMAGSVYLRRFGPRGRRLGSLIALPFVTILVVPYAPSTRFGAVGGVLVPVVVALLGLLWVSLFLLLGRRVRLLPRAAPRQDPPSRKSTLRPSASTRMAVQLGAALAVAFLVGYLFFPERWAWIVLTAFIVNSGNRGRGDVAYKSVLRVVGAGGGTLAALVIGTRFGDQDAITVALILTAVFLGLWLRPLGYAWWALFVTIALALLQGIERSAQVSPTQFLGQRLEEIVIGAVIGVAAAWFVLPVRSIAVLRGRIGDALAALQASLEPGATGHRFGFEMTRVREVAPTFRMLRGSAPAFWLRTLDELEGPAMAHITSGEGSAIIRRAVGNARRSLREPSAVGPALAELRDALQRA